MRASRLFPRGHGHSIEGMGNSDCRFVLIFDDGCFSEFGTFSVSDWLAHTPVEILAKNFGVAPEAFASFPTNEVYIAQGPVPAALRSLPGDFDHRLVRQYAGRNARHQFRPASLALCRVPQSRTPDALINSAIVR
jgi:oxalate decarboxylase/phosphoglucose isomerase-like protein (cupin superfamily)